MSEHPNPYGAAQDGLRVRKLNAPSQPQFRRSVIRKIVVTLLAFAACVVLAALVYLALHLYRDLSLVDAAADGTRKDVLKWLAAGADINATDNDRTALMFAVENLNHETAETLLDKGANPNLVNDNGDTALMLAADRNDPKLVRLLLSHGAKTDIVDNYGKTARSYAEIDKATSVLPLLPPNRKTK